MTKQKTVADYPELVAQWHPNKNGDLKPENLSYGLQKKVWWKCPVADDHEWEAMIGKRTSGGNGCPCCNGKKVVKSNCLATILPKIAAQWHPVKNGELHSDGVTPHSNKKAWWKCSKADDHEWEEIINNRVKENRGCPCCSGQKTVLSNCLATTHPEIAAQWHVTKNGCLTAKDFTSGSNRKVWWQCLVNSSHEWQSTIANRMIGRKCPVCKESKGEAAVAMALSNLSILFKREWRFVSCKNTQPLRFDFVVKARDGVRAIEYHGQQHYAPVNFGTSKAEAEAAFVRTQHRDAIKSEWCKTKHVPLLVIPYWNFDEIPSMVEQFVRS